MCFPWLRPGLLVGSDGRHCRSCWEFLLEQCVRNVVGVEARTRKSYQSLTLEQWDVLEA